MKHNRLLLLFIFILANTVQADTVYVTDMLHLSVYEEPESQGKMLKTLVSGEAVNLLERQSAYAKVQTSEGIIGWTKGTYLVTDKPARLIVTEMETGLKKAQAERDKALQAMTRAQQDLQQVQQALQTAETSAQTHGSELQRLQAENKKYENMLKVQESSVPLQLYAITAVICLVLGLVIGWYWIDARIRKRHGGFRIY